MVLNEIEKPYLTIKTFMNILSKCIIFFALAATVFADEDPSWFEMGYCKASYGGGYAMMTFGQCRYEVGNGLGMECWIGNLDGVQDSSIPCG